MASWHLFSSAISTLILVTMIIHLTAAYPTKPVIRKFDWDPYAAENDSQQNRTFSSNQLSGSPAFDRIGQPVYVTLTTIHTRLNDACDTISNILNGTLIPTHIYLFISKEPFIIDKGVTKENLESSGLAKLTRMFPQYFSIIYTNNIGPHRKLLPLLAEKWKEDCVIITIDDHTEYPLDIVSSLLDYYIASGRESVVALRARRIGLCFENDPWKTAPYPRKGFWPVAVPGRQEMLLLPTGSGGVLYRPKFFAEYIFDDSLRNLTRTNDDLAFRLGTMGKGVKVVTACNAGVRFLDTGKFIECPHINNLMRTLTFSNDDHYKIYNKDSSSSSHNHNHKHLRARHLGSVSDAHVVSIPSKSAVIFSSDTPLDIHSSNTNAFSTTSNSNDGSSSSSNTNSNSDNNSHTTNGAMTLWQMNQNFESNDIQWKNSIRYLLQSGYYDFTQELQKYAPIERSACRLNEINDGYLAKFAKKLGILFISLGLIDKDNTALGESKTLIQSAYDHECGIQFCHT